MKNNLIHFLFIALTCTATAHAGLYKGLDADGNTAYSDKPFSNAEEITPPGISVFDAVKPKPEKVIVEAPVTKVFKYTKFGIRSPANQQTIRNQPSLTVSLNLEPGLNTEEGHSIWLFLNGKPVVKNSKSLALSINRLDRGEHQLQALIKDKTGKAIKQTQTVTIHVKNTFIQRKADE